MPSYTDGLVSTDLSTLSSSDATSLPTNCSDAFVKNDQPQSYANIVSKPSALSVPFRHAVVSAVYADFEEKDRHAKNLVISGLPLSSTSDKVALHATLLNWLIFYTLITFYSFSINPVTAALTVIWICAKTSLLATAWFGDVVINAAITKFSTESTVFSLRHICRLPLSQKLINETGCSNRTIVDFYNFLREVCCVTLEEQSEPIGGPGKRCKKYK